jgi:hypothetical protein
MCYWSGLDKPPSGPCEDYSDAFRDVEMPNVSKTIAVISAPIGQRFIQH